MTLYEVFAIMHPSLSEEEATSLMAGLEKRIQDTTPGASVANRKIEYDESLAYSIKHQMRGHLAHLEIHLTGEEELSNDAHREMQFNDKVLRYLVFKKPIEPVRTTTESPVIDRIRTHESVSRDTRHATPQSPRRRTVAPVRVREEKGEMDNAEVDKKIEELLN